jgi:uncharacterized protein (TIGR03067 family)
MTHFRSCIRCPIAAVLLLVAVAPGQAPPARADEPSPRQAAKDDLKKLQGTWICVSMEREGDEMPAEAIKGSMVMYEDDRATLYRDGEVFRRALVTLDPARSPKRINSWDLGGPYEDQTNPGIYEVDGDTLKICFSRPGAERPTEFTTKKGPALLYLVYQRKKP